MSFGESHGPCVGIVVEGCPAGLRLAREDIQKELDRRRPGVGDFVSQRRERDEVEILSGLFMGRTTGAPLCLLIRNEGADQSAYERMRSLPRPGHADFTAHVKYGGFNDHMGGGRFSGRITAGFVAAGAIAKTLLRMIGTEVFAHAKEIAGIEAGDVDLETIKERREEMNPLGCLDPMASRRMAAEILKSKSEGDSVGGIIECIVLNPPIGLGEPVFDTLDGDLAKAFFAIPGVKGVEFGAGFKASRMRGSECNDPFIIEGGRVRTFTNNSGGILGGISNGMPIICRIAIKPTPSIRRPQRTVDLERMEEVKLTVEGAHDPCIVPRAIPVVEAMAAIILADHALRAGIIPPVIEGG
ncbi:MAG: chorismate synthase [Candidatus Bathyarchaeia archaeon]